MIYSKLTGGYLVPAYEIQPSEVWTVATGSTGTARITTSPKVQGTHSLQITSASAGNTVISSSMPVDLTAFDGIGMPTYAVAGSPLIVATARLLREPSGVTTIDDVVHDVAFAGTATATVGGQPCIRLTITGVAVANMTCTSGDEAVIYGSAFDQTYTVESVAPGPTAADTYLFVRSGGGTPAANATGRVRVYGTGAAYHRFTWPIAASGSSGLAAYGDAIYNVSTYGFDVSVAEDDWVITRALTDDLSVLGGAAWGEVGRVDLQAYFASAGNFYLDGIGGLVYTAEDAAANQFVSNLPEYHFDQPFTDAVATALGYELDALDGSVGTGLSQRLLPTASFDLKEHEQALDVPQDPRLRSIEVRRAELMGYLGMPATLVEIEAALSGIMGGAVSITETFATYDLDVAYTTADVTEQARLRRACTRLLPAHLAVTYDFS